MDHRALTSIVNSMLFVRGKHSDDYLGLWYVRFLLTLEYLFIFFIHPLLPSVTHLFTLTPVPSVTHSFTLTLLSSLRNSLIHPNTLILTQ